MLTLVALVQTQAQSPRGSLFPLLLQFGLIIAIFYFLFILPQRKEQKRHRELLAALRPGQEVVTSGGVVGEVITIKDDLVTLKSGDSRIVVERARIMRLAKSPAEPAK